MDVRAVLKAADAEIAAADRLLHVAYVARQLDVVPETVRGWIRRKQIAAITLPGGGYRILLSELTRIKTQKTQSRQL